MKKQIECNTPEKKRPRMKIHWGSAFIGAGSTLLLILLTVFFFLTPDLPGSLSGMRKILQAREIIHSTALSPVDRTKEEDDMMLGLVSSLDDPYAAYYTREDYREIEQGHKGKMEGIGITISQKVKDAPIIILGILEKSPAKKAGIKPGDVLLSIDGKSLEGETPQAVTEIIRKSKDKKIELEILRKKEKKTFSLKKEILDIKSASGEMLEDGIGYLRLTAFNQATPEQFEEIYKRLNKEKMKGLILDLRDNGGGLVDSCVKIASMILPKGPIVYEEDKNGRERHRDNEEDHRIKVPLALLVNGNTASASEILAGAIRDYKAGVLIGSRTFGKGIEQDTFRLLDDSRLKLTTTKYFTPEHTDLNGKGLDPDIREENPDKVLGRARTYLKKEIKKSAK